MTAGSGPPDRRPGAQESPLRQAEFDPEPHAVRAARAFVLHDAGLSEDQAFTVELLVSELAANAVLHARTPFSVRVHRGADRLRVEVDDGNPALPRPKPHSLDAPTGRGLRILESLADSWGTATREEGKTVWFEVPLLPDAIPTASEPSTAAPPEHHPVDQERGSAHDLPILTVQGDLDLRSAGATRDAIAALHADHPGDVKLDLRGVTFIDSVGISVLAAAHNRFARDQRVVHILLPGSLLPVFELTGLDEVFSISVAS